MAQSLSFIKSTLTCVALSGIAFAGNAKTADETVNFGTMEPGVTYEYPRYVAVYGEYTPSVTGPVRLLSSTTRIQLYTSKDFSDETCLSSTHAYVSGGRLESYKELEAGVTYYVYSPFTQEKGTVTIYEGVTELELLSVSPKLEEGEMFSVSSNYTIELGFNAPVTVGNVLLLAGDERARISGTLEESYLVCNVADAIIDFYDRGVLKEGDVMTLRVTNITDALDQTNKYGDNGRLELDFVMAAKPAQLVEVINADITTIDGPFNTYYLEGSEESVISLVFDEELSSEKIPNAYIIYGDSDNLDVGIYEEYVPGVNEGNTASFDFSGKLRRPIDMLPNSDSNTQPEYINIIFQDIYSADGQRAYTGRRTNPTGFSMSFKVNLLQYTIAADFTPGRGATLEPGSTMEIWVMNGAFISSTGISFTYLYNDEPTTTIVPMSEVIIEEDPIADTDLIYTFKVPDLPIEPGTKVTVSFADVDCADGIDHASDVTAEFNYGTSGVETISNTNDDTVTVYDIAGVRVLENASRNDLSKLSKGLYIVNGKKMVIK
ncbi:MAG: T9SS type A sorting domain-containing protein [Bacteroides sp.]|nr:T9SS type A sorting domain-containing protein [Bacteroides sp.]